jgi:hypothetical protein
MNLASRAFLLALSPLLFTGVARADDPPPSCDPDTYLCVKQEKVSLAKSKPDVEFDNGLNSGWFPACDGGNPKDPCNLKPSGDCGSILACLQVSMNDSKIDVSMLGDWDTFWPATDKLQIVPRKRPNGGKYVITYKLAPTFGLFINAFGYSNVITIDPLDILNALDSSGDVKDFNFTANGSCVFDPWAFTPFSCPVDGQPAEVFSLPLSDLTGPGIDKYVKIQIGLDAGTEDTIFTWQTTKLTVKNGAPITTQNGYSEIPYQGGSPVQVSVGATGTIGYKGKTYLKPTITILEIAGIKLGNGLAFPIDVGADVAFEGSIPVTLKDSAFDVPLPDLSVPTTKLNFGNVEVGQKASKMVKLTNTGGLLAKADLISSQAGSFQPQPASVEVADNSDGMVTINFLPKKAGTIEGTITVKSNDPDMPEQSFAVKGTGVNPGEDPPPDGDAGAAGAAGAAGKAAAGSAGSAGAIIFTDTPDQNAQTVSDGGCGCEVAGARRDQAPLGLCLGLAAGLVLARRRRRA